MEILVFWIMCGIATSMIFKTKGQNPVAGFFLGAILGPFGILFALIWSKNEGEIEQRAITSGSLRKCPDCAEMVKVEARKCRFCAAELQPIAVRDLAGQNMAPRVPGHSPKCGCKRCYVKR